MKPQQPNIDWCKKNREFVMRWLERRGGWQEEDWGMELVKEVCLD